MEDSETSDSTKHSTRDEVFRRLTAVADVFDEMKTTREQLAAINWLIEACDLRPMIKGGE